MLTTRKSLRLIFKLNWQTLKNAWIDAIEEIECRHMAFFMNKLYVYTLYTLLCALYTLFMYTLWLNNGNVWCNARIIHVECKLCNSSIQ